MQEYVEAVQTRIDECENMVRKHIADLMMDNEDLKEYSRTYINSFFE